MSIREEMETREKAKRKSLRIMLYVFIACGVIISFFDILIGMLIVIPLVILIATVQTVRDINHESQDFAGKIKQEIAPKIIKAVIPDAERFMDEGISKEEYLSSEFIESCDEYLSHDKIVLPLMSGENKINEVELFDVSHKITDGQKNEFYGIYGRMHLPRDIRTKIKISNEGKYVEGNIFKYEMENKAFENVFDVMAMNKNIAKSVLTEDVMTFMLEIYKTYNYIVEVSIIRNMLHIRVIGKPKTVQTNEGSAIDRKAVDNHYSIMKEIRELIYKLYANIEALELK